MKKSVFVLFSLCLALSCDASVWPAVWIGCHAEKSGADLRVAYFRKSAQLNTVPDAHLIRVSADNRYKLFVNGVLVSLGPARSDLSNWNYETVDIAPYLRQGKNTLAAVVWNYGEKRPMAQMGTNEIALLVCADGAAPVFNTDWNWQVLTVLVKDGGDEVTFWSSNVPDGYGSKTVPKSKIKRVIFTRITRPERFNLAPSIGHNAWLASLLKQDVSMKEVRSHCGMKEP